MAKEKNQKEGQDKTPPEDQTQDGSHVFEETLQDQRVNHRKVGPQRMEDRDQEQDQIPHRSTIQEAVDLTWADLNWGRWVWGSEGEGNSDLDDFNDSEGDNSDHS